MATKRATVASETKTARANRSDRRSPIASGSTPTATRDKSRRAPSASLVTAKLPEPEDRKRGPTRADCEREADVATLVKRKVTVPEGRSRIRLNDEASRAASLGPWRNHWRAAGRWSTTTASLDRVRNVPLETHRSPGKECNSCNDRLLVMPLPRARAWARLVGEKLTRFQAGAD